MCLNGFSMSISGRATAMHYLCTVNGVYMYVQRSPATSCNWTAKGMGTETNMRSRATGIKLYNHQHRSCSPNKTTRKGVRYSLYACHPALLHPRHPGSMLLPEVVAIEGADSISDKAEEQPDARDDEADGEDHNLNAG